MKKKLTPGFFDQISTSLDKALVYCESLGAFLLVDYNIWKHRQVLECDYLKC